MNKDNEVVAYLPDDGRIEFHSEDINPQECCQDTGLANNSQYGNNKPQSLGTINETS